MTQDLIQQSSALNLQTAQLKTDMADLGRLATGFGQTMTRSFTGAIVQGKKFSDVLKSLATSLISQSLSAGIRPLGNLVGGLFGKLFASAQGNIISGGQIKPFASGGIINSPTLFPMRGGTGLMGEAGPEAIMPLARGSDGKLGIRGASGASQVTINITTPDVESFRQSQSQVASAMARAVARGQRNL